MSGNSSTSGRAATVGADGGGHHTADQTDRVVKMVREISRQTDPQEMISVFRQHTALFFGGDNSLSLSRRELDPPRFRITRSTRWSEDINPWTERDRLPVLEGGLLAELLYDNEPRILRDVCVRPDDPAYEYLRDARSLMYLPLFEAGEAINGVLRTSPERDGFDHINLADAVLTGNLFGRATSNLLVAQELRAAYAELDREMKRVSQIQRALLPLQLPSIPTLDIAASYKTAARAGGDYYDFFDLGDGRWGVLIADVSGHGTPAAVVMAILRTMLHAQCHKCRTPAEVLCYANQQLCNQSERHSGTFVTAFYAIYDPRDYSLTYASAGHNPPLLVDCRIRVRELDEAQSIPLGIQEDWSLPEASVKLKPGDTLLLYTDGITEASNAAHEMYGRARLLECVRENVPNAQHIIDCVVHKLIAFTGGGPQDDDQTLVAMRVR